jgi:hypothetical protein
MNPTPALRALDSLQNHSQLSVTQKFEWGELLGFETRNKFQILQEDGTAFAYAAEQNKGLLSGILRQIFGHWRSFEIHFFSPLREPFLVARHPFRWFFSRIEVRSPDGRYLGAIQKRFSVFSKAIDVENEVGATILEVRSPFWRPWRFPFVHLDKEKAVVCKRWSGAISEIFTDRDNFLVQFLDPQLPAAERALVLAAAIFIDLLYFEKKARLGN